MLAAALRQVPVRFGGKILVRVDEASASHDLIGHLLSLSSARKTLLFTCGWMITAADVILSFRVSRVCDLLRPVVDSVADRTLAA